MRPTVAEVGSVGIGMDLQGRIRLALERESRQNRGMRFLRRVVDLVLLAPGWGCSHHATQAQLRAAAHDLDCPTDNLRHCSLGERSCWAAGYGKLAT
ncbi:MAG: hypothetical protein RMJ98_12115 [Myxococcales bacterium]|nr:hypothetical protein [Polyangiaceae bacterium]MDW8250032.1 hypothetical protein [Myxococcales bacterium]